MTNKEQLIDNIMDNFDFTRVATTMKALEWGWFSLDMEVPEEFEIRRAARKLLKEVPETFHKERRLVGTGGLYVESWYEDRQLVMMQLTFVVSEWSEDVRNIK